MHRDAAPFAVWRLARNAKRGRELYRMADFNWSRVSPQTASHGDRVVHPEPIQFERLFGIDHEF